MDSPELVLLLKIVAPLSTVISVLASALAVMYRDRIKELKNSLAYERKQKEDEVKYSREIASNMIERLKDVSAAVNSIGPAVTNDGGRTRSHVSAKLSETVIQLQGRQH